jgi:flagella basal body P-ring formation protein FlgA
VALQNIPRGAEITSNLVGPRDWPRDYVPPDVIADEAELIGKVAKVEIFQGQPIVRSMLADRPVMVALQYIPRGTEITPDLVGREYWRRDDMPPDVIADESELIGKVANTDILSGQPIARSMLADAQLVIVALESIPRGREIKPDLVDRRYWPRDDVPPDVIADESEVIGKVAYTHILPDQPIVRSMLTDDVWWETFTPDNSDLAGPSILTLVEDTQGRIWAGTESGGVSRFQDGIWETVLLEGAGGRQEVRITAMLLDHQGALWVATSGNGVLRFEGDSLQRFTSDSGLGDDVVSEIFEDSLGRLWFGTESGVSRFDGENWESFTAKDGLAGQVTVITEDPSGTLWLGGPDGLTRYDGESWVSFTALNSGLVTDEVQDLLVDGERNLWVSTFRVASAERPQWPALSLTVLAFGGMLAFTYYRYGKMPETRAQRIHHTLRQQPDTLYPTIYRLFAETPDAPEVLRNLAEEMGYVGDRTGARVVAGLAALPSAESLAEALPNSVTALADGSSYEGGAVLHELYRLFAAAYEADTFTQMTALEITVIPNLLDNTYTVSTSLGDIKALPLFLSSSLPTTLTALEDTADALMKHEQVDTLGDKLAYLADALHEIEKAAQSTQTLAEPEKTVLAGITAKWREVIAREIAKVSGRAELRAELRTKQALFSERLAAVLRLENTGQAVAENVRVSLEPSEEYEVVGQATLELARVSTRRPSDMEFTIHPKREDRVRLDFTITWDDREGKGKSRRFADTVSFVEVEREFTRIPNPYVAGNPITSPKLFFGREDVFDFVLENLVGAEQKNTLVLHGQRRTGKSSVLLQLRDRVLPQKFIPVYINMEALPDVKTMEAFLARLAYEIGRAARKPSWTQPRMSSEGSALWSCSMSSS